MFDHNNKRIVAGNYLRDVRFGKGVYILVQTVVSNTRIEGIGTHHTAEGKWLSPYAAKIEGTHGFEIVAPESLPGEARYSLLERARTERDAQRRETPTSWRECN